VKTTIDRLLRDERVRFVLIGGVNTVVGYALFAALDVGVGHWIGYLGSLYGSYALAVPLAFVLHRRFTFRVAGSGSTFVDFVRFASVYVVSLAINTALLPLLVEVAHLSPLVAQAITIVVTTLMSYFGHKLFSFRRGSRPPAATSPETPFPNR
jgi:putative flippase GtrA